VLGTGIAEAGGLHIIGTERHESRRIDNQLRGRAGRQGDPGSSTFYLSLEDDLMRRFASDRVSGLMERLGMDDDTPIEARIISKSIENAQTKVEGHNFDLRKHVVEYDDVMNKQREVIYARRRKILEGGDMREQVLDVIAEQIGVIVEVNWPDERNSEPDLEEILSAYRGIVPMTGISLNRLHGLDRELLEELLIEDAEKAYEKREQDLTPEIMRRVERAVMLNVMDKLWRDHLTHMDDMRQSIGLQAYAQKDPLIAYKTQGFDMFEGLLRNISYDIAHQIYQVSIERRPLQPAPRRVVTNQPTDGAAQPVAAAKSQKVGRNDPCPCGSGKKYKHCHGRSDLVRAS
jgi:preprotein translocase subunit SecA